MRRLTEKPVLSEREKMLNETQDRKVVIGINREVFGHWTCQFSA